MKLNNIPTIKNVEKLKKYVRGVSEPYKKLAEYEENLLVNGTKIRALARICNSDNTDLINVIEGTKPINWYKISNLANLNDIPNEYFDIILWSDCDLESELRQLFAIENKLKPGGRIYFNNLLTDFDKVIKNCVNKLELETSNELVRSLFKSILGDKYTTELVLKNGEVYLVFIKKRKINFKIDKKLQAELLAIDNKALNLVSKTRSVTSIINTDLLFKTITELILNDDPVNWEIVNEKTKNKYTKDLYEKVKDNITRVNEQIDVFISEGIYNTSELLAKLPDILNLDITSEKNWIQYVKDYFGKNIEEEYSYKSEGSEVGSDVEVYPVIKEDPSTQTELVPSLLPGLENIGGYSCFMDSLLFTLLLPNSGYIASNLLNKKLDPSNVKACEFFNNSPTKGLEYLEKFQQELQKLAIIIRNERGTKTTCLPIVNIMKKCSELTKELMSGEQQDDSEFLIALFQIFNLEPTTVSITRAVSKDSKEWIQTTSRKEKIAILEISLPENGGIIPDLLKWYQAIKITDYQNVDINDWALGPENIPQRYQYSSEKYTITDSELLIFHISRIQFIWKTNSYVKNNTIVNFEKYIKDGNNFYEVYIITIHYGSAEGGHYTSYFKYNAQWYYYDDILPSADRIKAVTLKQVTEEAVKNGSLFFYRKI